MKRILMAGAVILVSLGATRAALATTAVELVTVAGGNTDIIYYDGSSLACSVNGAANACSGAGFGTVSATNGGVWNVSASAFGGWQVSDNASNSSPDCSPGGDCLDQQNIDVTSNGATNSLTAYYAVSGFTAGGPLDFMESGTAVPGTATANGYAYKPNGSIGLSSTVVPDTSIVPFSSPFASLSLSSPGFLSSPGHAAPSSGYNLAGSMTLAPTSNSARYNVTETISSAVPESSSVGVFLVAIIGIAFGFRRRTNQTAA